MKPFYSMQIVCSVPLLVEFIGKMLDYKCATDAWRHFWFILFLVWTIINVTIEIINIANNKRNTK